MTNLETITNEIKTKFESKKVAILYAFNSVGKTRLSGEFENLNKEDKETGEIEYKTLCYSAFVEDLFSWDNEDYILNLNSSSWVLKIIIDEGLSGKIIDNFQSIILSKTEPNFNHSSGEITFNLATGDSESQSSIKISKGEESIFIWSIFYTILEVAIDELSLKETERSTKLFNNLEYVVIDDPVSSIDDTRIIALAVKIGEQIKLNRASLIDLKTQEKKKELIEQDFTIEYIDSRIPEIKSELEESYEEINLKFLITTHHPLFYNILCNSIKNKKRHSLILRKIENKLELKYHGDSPFGYHLCVKEDIQQAINTDNIKKYHFNLFMGLLEKTTNFLGLNGWGDCLNDENRDEFARLVNLYSHGKLSELEANDIPDADKNLFKKEFSDFIKKYNFKQL